MGMTVEKYISLFHRWHFALVINMAVSEIYHFFTEINQSIIGENRKIQYHLINLRLAISSDAENIVLHFVEHCNNLFWCILFGQIVSRAVIKHIAEKDKPVGLFFFIFFNKFAAPVCTAVNIGSNQPFHALCLLSECSSF